MQKPCYISLEYVLARAGVTFQYSEDITCISYQTRTIEVDGKSYVYNASKKFARKDLIPETASALELFASFPLFFFKSEIP